MTETTKVADDIFMVPWDQGNGQLRREVWVDQQDKVRRYYLAFVNPETFAEEDGMVLGYDFDGGKFRSHLKGAATTIDLFSFEELEELFDIKWANLPKDCVTPLAPGEAGPAEIDVAKIDETDDYAETKDMKLTITKGSSADFFKRGRELARKLDMGEHVEPEKVVIFGHRDDLCYTMLQKK
jgi:hypothetical protein